MYRRLSQHALVCREKEKSSRVKSTHCEVEQSSSIAPSLSSHNHGSLTYGTPWACAPATVSHAPVELIPAAHEGFHGGPKDMSLLPLYACHVALLMYETYKTNIYL